MPRFDPYNRFSLPVFVTHTHTRTLWPLWVSVCRVLVENYSSFNNPSVGIPFQSGFYLQITIILFMLGFNGHSRWVEGDTSLFINVLPPPDHELIVSCVRDGLLTWQRSKETFVFIRVTATVSSGPLWPLPSWVWAWDKCRLGSLKRLKRFSLWLEIRKTKATDATVNGTLGCEMMASWNHRRRRWHSASAYLRRKEHL